MVEIKETSEEKLNSQRRWFAALKESRTPAATAYGLALEITHQAELARQEQGVTKSELARRMGVSASYASRLLRGEENSTLLSLVKLGEALGLELKTEFQAVPSQKGAVARRKPVQVSSVKGQGTGAAGNKRRNKAAPAGRTFP